MRRSLFAAGALALAIAAGACSDKQNVYTATLSAVSGVTTSAGGSATFTRMDDQTVSYTITVSDIDNVTAAHIHDGAAGQTGAVVVDLFDGTFSGSGTLASATFSGGSAVTGMSFDELLDRMAAGTVYVNVHTTANPAGEIRGQIAQTGSSGGGIY